MKHIKTLLSGILLSACIITLAGCKGGAESYLNKGNEYLAQEDYGMALSCFLIANELSGGNNPVCLLNIGNCYDGEGEYEQAVVWYSKSAEQGNAEAQFLLGCCYHVGSGVTENKETAVYWYSKSAEQGNAEAQNQLAYCYENGEGVAVDEQMAVYWCRKAAEQGIAWSQYRLGLCYDSGEGVAEDKETAVYWYRKAAEQGHAEAQNQLAYCYEIGKGVAEDKEMAAYWRRKAAENDELLEIVRRDR